MPKWGAPITIDEPPRDKPRIVLSYRREDTSADAGRLFDHLSRAFGSERVFMDIDTIQPGDDFVDVIEKAVSASDAIVAVIGKRWVDGLDDPRDFVRFEIATALRLRKRIIPLLVGDAEMPSPTKLPEDIAGLARLHAINVSHLRFHSDADRLVETLHRHFSRAEPKLTGQEQGQPYASRNDAPNSHPRSSPIGLRMMGIGIGAVALVVVAVAVLLGGWPFERGSSDELPNSSGDAHRGPTAAVKLEPYADLEGVNLQSMFLVGLDLRGAHMKGADISAAFLDRAVLVSADLRGAHLAKARLVGADLRKANLEGADLQGADLGGADLDQADLSSANLRSVSNLDCERLRRAAIWASSIRDPSLECSGSAR